MSTRDKLAQLLMVGVRNGADARDVVDNYHVGGIFIGSWTDKTMLTDGSLPDIVDGGPLPLAVSVDEEGGRVTRLSSILGPLPSARVLAQTHTPDEVYQIALDRGRQMRGLGITVDFAPDVDVTAAADDTVIDGDRMYTYYGGWNGDHKSNLREAAISRVESPRDRFIGWRTHGPEPGFLLTRPMLAAGARVTVNASVRGQLAMAVCDDRGAALPGFAFDDCGPVHGDGFAHAVSWKGDWRTLNGRAVRLRVRVRDGAFYSLTFA